MNINVQGGKITTGINGKSNDGCVNGKSDDDCINSSSNDAMKPA